MNKVSVQAKTIEEAVQSALEQLQKSEDEVEIRVVQEPSRGFLGIGSKEAIVEVMLKETDDLPKQPEGSSERLTQAASVIEDDHARSVNRSADDEQLAETVNIAFRFLKDVLQKMNVDVHIRQKYEHDRVLFDISGPKLGMIIGRRGQTLDALQYLTNVVANRHAARYVRIVLDAENYREKRKEALHNLADRLAKKAIRTHQKVVLEPMNPAERKIIHTYLHDYAGVSTKSEGEEPNRRVVLYPE